MGEKLLLIDGHSILNRAFYGVPELSNAKGLHTNAIYGFLNILFKILDQEGADYITVAFDVKEPTFRHKMYDAYKGTRRPMPEELREQVPVMKEVLEAMGIYMVEKAGYEADDILGTIAKMGEKAGFQVTIVSGDRDLLQLATDGVKIRIPKTKGGKTEIEDYYKADVLEKYKVTPLQFIELKALMGDTADNIPGVPKVGEKTATELIVSFGSVENLYHHLEEVTKKSIKLSLEENKDLAFLSKKLAAIDTNVNISYDFSKAKIKNFYTKEAYDYMKKLEFKSILDRFEKGTEEKEQNKFFQKITGQKRAEEIFKQCLEKKEIGFQALEEDGELLGAALTLSEKEIYYIEVGEEMKEQDLLSLIKKLGEEVIKKESFTLITHGLKRQFPFWGISCVKNFFDVEIGAYLLNPLKNSYEIEEIAYEYSNLSIPGRTQLFGKISLKEKAKEEPEQFLQYACNWSYSLLMSRKKMEERLFREGMGELFYHIEMPLTFCLYEMEREGIKIRKEELKAYGEQLIGRISQLEEEIHEEAGENFNIQSPKQLGEILFEKMGIKGGKKTKTGYSTAADVLEKLAPHYPIVNKVLEYRGLAKLKSTYADGLAACIREEDRIHSTFNQTITATGRISSTEPNLQNIPVRMELGRLIRKVFVPKEGYVFLDADYSQIELRILAHMSGDERLIEAYNKAEDIHRMTASEVFHTPFEEVTDLQRRNAKAVNFGIVYGISSFGLSQDLSITRKEAKQYIEKYFDTYPQVKEFLDCLVTKAKEKGYVSTLYGRRRPVPELSSSNFMQRSFGERVAMNAPIQGTAADIIKIAMIQVSQELKKRNMKSKLILQVHDELLIETAKEDIEEVKSILKEKMQGAADLSVPLEVDMHQGNNWYEAK